MTNSSLLVSVTSIALLSTLLSCSSNEPPGDAIPPVTPDAQAPADPPKPEPQYFLTDENTHNKFSSTIPPILTVPSGAVVEAKTKEASDGQITRQTAPEDLASLNFDLVHPLTGPIYVEGAVPGDVLAVTMHEIELGDWGWTTIIPGFNYLSEDFPEPHIRTFELGKDRTEIRFNDRITIPLRPFAGVMGVAPDTTERLSTIPPRANGGNMDDPHMTVGVTVYFPVFVEGALFSIGDAHAVQGAGEVCGTAIEAPMRFVFELEVIKGGRPMQEPQYETEESYAVTAFATTLDEASKKATRYMIDYLVAEHGLTRADAYMLCSLAGDLRIAEVVDLPHVLVSMHMPKKVLGIQSTR